MLLSLLIIVGVTLIALKMLSGAVSLGFKIVAVIALIFVADSIFNYLFGVSVFTIFRKIWNVAESIVVMGDSVIQSIKK